MVNCSALSLPARETAVMSTTPAGVSFGGSANRVNAASETRDRGEGQREGESSESYAVCRQ
jgi:hypothetical protein